MKKIVLISCVKTKQNHKSKAKDLYISSLFKKSYAYAKTLNPDKIYILSAKYGLLEEEEIIEPYELTLKNSSVVYKKKWATRVIKQLETVSDLQKDLFIFLAGIDYRKFLISHIINVQIPMEKLDFGNQLSWLKNKLRNE